MPVAVTRNGSERMPQTGLTKNISSGGILFTAENEPDVGGAIEYIVTLGAPSEQNISLRCIGKVLRAHRLDSGNAAYEIAATLERYEFLRPEA